MPSSGLRASIGRTDFKASARFYRSFNTRFPDLKPRKTSSLDLRRVTLDDMINRLHEKELIPYAKFEDWPANLKYSYDEGE